MFFAKGEENSECESARYIQINNCGWFEDLVDTHVVRASGRIDYQLLYIKSGEVTVKTETETYLLKEGSVLLYRPGKLQDYRIGKRRTTYYWIHFTGAEAEKILSFWKEVYYQVGALPELEKLCREYYEMYRTSGDFCDVYHEGCLIALLGLLCIQTKQQRNRQTAKIKPALLAIEEYASLDNASLAKLCYMSKYHFIKLFKTAMGVTPGQYKSQKLTEQAKHLLLYTDMKVEEIAKYVGVEDALYFSRMFKKQTGMAPSVYRKNNGVQLKKT
ncbi:MAG: helix-turn-helix transcriptional regulator [Clostridia bacterium]|nr:helix-turn-helix transcriptional regulator [Clostridia bacterium]